MSGRKDTGKNLMLILFLFFSPVSFFRALCFLHIHNGLCKGPLRTPYLYTCARISTETPLYPLLSLKLYVHSRLKWGCNSRRAIWNRAFSAAALETSRLFAYLRMGLR